jgi:hypothetical protein
MALAIRQKFPPPAGVSVSDDDLIEAVFQEATSGSQHILQFLARHNVNSGLFSTWLKVALTDMQAEILNNALQMAQSLHEIDVIRDADQEGVPRDIYSEVVRDKKSTDERIRLENELSRLHKDRLEHEVETKMSGAERANLATQTEQKALEREIDDLFTELEKLEATEPKTEILKRRIEVMEERIAIKRK